jgi:phosphate transport system protein
MRHFVTDLTDLQNKLLEMGGLVESAIRLSVRSLAERNEELARGVWDVEERINRLDIDIDEFATSLLATQQPVAGDLRFLTAAIKINSDLERMGDLAINIAQRSLSLIRRTEFSVVIDIPHMARIVESMVHQSLDAFVQRDAELAHSVLLADDEVDDLKNAVYRELLALTEAGKAPAAAAFDVIFVAHNLERVADHATNIAEDVLFLIKGIDVRHHHLA